MWITPRSARSGGRQVELVGDREGDPGAAFAATFGPDAPAMGRDQVLAEGQPQAGAVAAAGSRPVDLVEAFKDPRQLRGRNPRTPVANPDLRLRGAAARTDR